MIKLETIGMLDRVVVNPVITSEQEMKNYSFITENNELYLIANTITGDKAGVDDVTIKAGEYLNGYLVKSLEGQKLVIDGKHIKEGVGSLSKDSILVVDTDGKLKTGEASGIHFIVTDTNVTLTEKAVKVKVVVAAAG